MASQSFAFASRDLIETEEGDHETVSKEVSESLPPCTVEQLMSTVHTLASTMTNQMLTLTTKMTDQMQTLTAKMTNQMQTVERDRQADRQRYARDRQEDRESQEQALAAAMAISKASERYSMLVEKNAMEVMDELRQRQDDIEDNLGYEIDTTADRHPDRFEERTVSSRPELAPALAAPPSSRGPGEDRPWEDSSGPRRSERLRRRMATYRPELIVETDELASTSFPSGASGGQEGQIWLELPESPRVAPRLTSRDFTQLSPPRPCAWVAGDEERTDDDLYRPPTIFGHRGRGNINSPTAPQDGAEGWKGQRAPQ